MNIHLWRLCTRTRAHRHSRHSCSLGVHHSHDIHIRRRAGAQAQDPPAQQYGLQCHSTHSDTLCDRAHGPPHHHQGFVLKQNVGSGYACPLSLCYCCLLLIHASDLRLICGNVGRHHAAPPVFRVGHSSSTQKHFQHAGREIGNERRNGCESRVGYQATQRASAGQRSR